jgi:hypothetical protein
VHVNLCMRVHKLEKHILTHVHTTLMVHTQGAEQARAWHTKQVADARTAVDDLKAQLLGCAERLKAARSSLQQ